MPLTGVYRLWGFMHVPNGLTVDSNNLPTT